MTYTLIQRYTYTPIRNYGWPNMLGYRSTNSKSGKMAHLNDIILMVILLMMLLEYSNYTSKKGESTHFKRRHRSTPAFVGELQHSDVYSIPGSKNMTRSLLKRNWSDKKGYEANTKTSANGKKDAQGRRMKVILEGYKGL